jgi:hypothetical protein
MIIIQIGDTSREYSSIRDIEEGWILHQIIARRKAGEQVGVRVSIRQHPLEMSLATPNIQSGGGGGRQANEYELTAFNLWNECELNTNGFAPGRLIEFLKRVAKLFR